MRPLYLSIEGLNSFKEKQEIDFTSLTGGNIFCIYGPTGSGKTTILDAVIFALYGRNERVDKIEEYINLSMDRAEIVFRFLFEGDEYEVQKILRRRSGDKAYFYRNGELKADGASAVSEAVEKLVGLNKKEFTQVVILEQGEFAKFLKSSPADRNNTVARLFELDRFKDLFSKFNNVAKKYKDRVDQAEALLANYESATPENLALKKAEIKTLKHESERAEKDLKTALELKSRMSVEEEKFRAALDSRAAIDGAKARLSALNDKTDKLSERKAAHGKQKSAYDAAQKSNVSVIGLLSKIEEIRKQEPERKRLEKELEEKNESLKKGRGYVDQKDAEVKSHTETYKALGAELIKLRSGVSELSGYSAADTLDKDAENLAAFLSNITTLKAELDSNARDIAALNSSGANSETGQNESRAEQKVIEKSVASALENLARELKEGDECPLCGETLGTGNRMKHEREANLRRLTDRRAEILGRMGVKDAASADKLAALAISDIPEKYRGISKQYETSRQDLERFTLRYEKVDAEARGLKGELDRIKNQIAESVGENYPEKEIELNRQKGDNDRIITDYEKEQKALATDEQELSSLAASDNAIIKEHEKLLENYKNITFNQEAFEKVKRDADALKQQSDTLSLNLAEKNAELSVLESNLEIKKRLSLEIAADRKKYDTAHALGNIFKGNKFLEYALLEYIEQFTLDASEKLFTLSGGKYALSYSGDDAKSGFYVTDYLRGGEKRKARTLSGGETFLASVALAMAISDKISKEKSFDFFFLDEGFGTLDENAIDIVSQALFTLSSNTLVGVVTHRNELRERIPQKIEIIGASESEGSLIKIKWD